jgi:nicotinamidase-related amidase
MIRGLEQGQRPALLISECQRGILDPKRTSLPGLAEQAADRGIFAKIAQLAGAFRTRSLPVIHIHIGHRPDFSGYAATSPLSGKSRRDGSLILGSEEVEAMPGVEPAEGDFICSRRSGLAMWYGTDLDAMLRNSNVDTVVLSGVSTNLALFGGSLGAIDRGYQAVLAEDASAGGTAETHAWMLANTYPMLASISNVRDIEAALSPG